MMIDGTSNMVQFALAAGMMGTSMVMMVVTVLFILELVKWKTRRYGMEQRLNSLEGVQECHSELLLRHQGRIIRLEDRKPDADRGPTTKEVQVDVDGFTGRECRTYFCKECGGPVNADDTVWVDPATGKATTGNGGWPYHVSCAPPEQEE